MNISAGILPLNLLIIVNSLLKTRNKNIRNPYKKYIVDGTAVECDINHVKQYISPEKLKKLKTKMGDIPLLKGISLDLKSLLY